MRNLHYIAIEGTIGVGKTSLANLLSERLKAKLVLEEFEGNPFLSDFYEDPERHAFQTQLWFLIPPRQPPLSGPRRLLAIPPLLGHLWVLSPVELQIQLPL